MIRSVVLAVLLGGCLAVDSDSVTPLVSSECPPVQTSRPVVTGEVVTTDLRGLAVDNGIVRIRYGAHGMDFRDAGVTNENTARFMDHVLAGRHMDDPSVVSGAGCVSGACHSNGSHWHDAVLPWYGDGTKYVQDPARDADRVRVLYAGADAVELAYEWDHVRLDGLRSPGVCQIGRYPECGPSARDGDGQYIYKRDGETLKSVKVVKLWKAVRVERCTPGYYVSLRSNPPLVWPEQGARGMRLGYVSTVAAWTCDGAVIARHPNAGFHADLGVTDCIADIPTQLTGHNSWPFIRFMRTRTPTRFTSLQYSPGQLGSPGTQDLWDSIGPDGRPSPWQAFIGAVEYVSSDIASEPTVEAMQIVTEAIPGMAP